MSRHSRHASDIYADEMQVLREGRGLWRPEPNEEVIPEIGDVGFFVEGAFNRLFNLIPNKAQPTVPASDCDLNFATFEAPFLQNHPDALDPGPYLSSSVTSISGSVNGTAGPATATVGYRCESEQGAILQIHSAADKKFFLPCSQARDFIKRNYDSWHQYALEQGLTPEKDIVIAFVNGYIRTSSDWEVAAFQTRGSMYTVGVDAQAAGMGGAGAALAAEQHRRSPTFHRKGKLMGPSPAGRLQDPQWRASGGHHPTNQTIFVRYYRVKRILYVIKHVVAGAGPDHIDADRTGDGAGISIQSPDEYGDASDVRSSDDPLEGLLDYILESSDATTAIASLDDLYLLLPTREWPSDIKLYLQHMQPRIDVDGDKVGSIAALDAIQRNRRSAMTAALPLQAGPVDEGDAAPGAITEGHMSPGHGPSANTTLDWPHAMFRHKDAENGSVSCAVVSPNGKLLAVAWDDTVITVWALKDGSVVQQLQNPGHLEAVWALAFSPDSTHLVSGSADCRGIIWDIEDRPDQVEGGLNQHILIKHTGHVMTVAYSPTGRLVATGAQDSLVCLWDTETGDIVHTLEGHEYDITKVAFSPSDGAHLASASDSVVFVWDVVTGTKIAELAAHQGAIWAFAFSPDGDRIITGSEDTSSRVWDVASGAELVILHEHTDAVLAVAFSPDGNEVATGAHDAALVSCGSWDGSQRFVFDAQQASPVEAVAYAHSGQFVAAGYADGNIRLWDTKSGGSVAEYRGHEGKIRSVEFTVADEELVSSADDGTIRVWNVWDTLRVL